MTEGRKPILCKPVGRTDTRQGWIPALRKGQGRLFGGISAACSASPARLGSAVLNAAERELFFYEGCANVYGNKGPVRRDEDGSGNILENKGTYPLRQEYI